MVSKIAVYAVRKQSRLTTGEPQLIFRSENKSLWKALGEQ
jgi:hypothetical protein